MGIKKLTVSNFMCFKDLNIQFSSGINIICGENSTGKTALLKLLYASLKGCSSVFDSKKKMTNGNVEASIVSKIQGVFRPDNDVIGRLVSRVQGANRTDICISFEAFELKYGFSSKHSTHLEIKNDGFGDIGKASPVYIPPKEIISAIDNFGSLYSDYHIAFEETYYDLTRLLEKPLRKGKNTNQQNRVLESFESIVQGKIIQRDKKFYLKVSGAGEFEMGLVSEGYRKLATIMYLILSGSLNRGSILFWDEPETNMNPKMIKPLTDALVSLAEMDVQIFVTTHDYFVQQCFNMNASYGKESDVCYRFFSLTRNEAGDVVIEEGDTVSDLSHNAIMDEFDALYDREQELIYNE